MRLLSQIVGHEEIIEKMLHSFVSGRPGQTFMFVGPAGIGKKQVARGLAQALLCEKDLQACGVCSSCLRVANNQHDSLILVEPEGPQIKIDQARAVLEKLSLRSLSKNRVIILNQAQLMNPQAANALLKMLEEPPEGTFFFMIAPTQSGLLSTLRSRSRVVQFHPLTYDQILSKEKAPTWMIKASAGSFEKLALLQEPTEQQVRLKALELLQLFLKDPDFLTNETWRILFKERAQAQKYLAYWISFIRDGIFYAQGGKEQVVNADQLTVIQFLAQRSPHELLSLIQKCLQSERAFGSNQDGVLFLEKIWVTEKENYVD
jgi:DNA polymerase-3 subunit delta'